MSDLEAGDISKALFQYQGKVTGLLEPLKRYGQNAYVDMVVLELVKLGWQLHYRLEGIDTPYEVDNLHW